MSSNRKTAKLPGEAPEFTDWWKDNAAARKFSGRRADYCEAYELRAAEIERLRALLERSRRGEHICLKCGLRQDTYDAAGHAAAYPGF